MIENNEKVLKFLECFSNIKEISYIIYGRLIDDYMYVYINNDDCAAIHCDNIKLFNIKNGSYTYKEFKKILKKSIKNNGTRYIYDDDLMKRMNRAVKKRNELNKRIQKALNFIKINSFIVQASTGGMLKEVQELRNILNGKEN